MTAKTRPRAKPITDDGLRLEYVPLDELQKWEANPKDHDLGLLNQAIGRWGFLNPVLIDERTGLLNAGHGRLETLEQMRAGGQAPPKYVQTDGGGRWLLPVLRGWSSASDADAAARAVADNRTQEMGGWDDAALAEVLEGLAREGDGMLEGVGFDADDLDALLSSLEHGPAAPLSKEPKPNPRKLNIDAVFTVNGGRGICCVAVDAGLKYGRQSQRREACAYAGPDTRHALTFLDNDYFAYDHAEHVRQAAAGRPKYVTVRDAMTRDQCRESGVAHYPLAQILEWAAELEQHAQRVIVIPKYDCLDKIPERYVLGYSLPSSHGSTPLPLEAFAGRKVHLLGGSWRAQLGAMEALGDDVVSFDNNHVLKLALYAKFVRADGAQDDISNLGFGSGAVTNGYTLALVVSFGSIAAKVNELYPGAATPTSPEEYLAALPAGRQGEADDEGAEGEGVAP